MKTLALPILKSYKLADHLSREETCPKKILVQSAGESSASESDVAAKLGATSSSSTMWVENPKFERLISTTNLLLLGWLCWNKWLLFVILHKWMYHE
ncbi:uncharacterized protein E5676_scaffold110G001700 [Cucumis melo var. makuwa]|uniref:Uncharacterized protein n=1 Tax=Cucumis melo var. makuwa TaxID=1194695 RepID=A0A5A7T5D3_CUCMM|nr:uncharacterized protein E6C27_scaffold20G001000 [Cucumis melo var. makuwa]TYJ95875.1 uncharacterized protein E5676_scaffold110G001700 [Cucumis melo var. makuwa]